MEQEKKPAHPAKMQVVRDSVTSDNPWHELKLFTKRETEVLYLLCKAYSRKNIAAALAISIDTVDKHVHSIHIKTNSHSIAELLNWCFSKKHPNKI